MIANSKRWLKTLVVIKDNSLNGEKYNSNSDKWIHTLPRENNSNSDKLIHTLPRENNSNSDKWIHILPRENKKYFLKNYSLITALFIVGLMFVSVIKNETRNLQKNINIFQNSINSLKVDLHQESLDYEIITSPENLTILAKEYLEVNLVPYKRPQIQELKKAEAYIKNENENENKKLKTGIKENIFKTIKKKRVELAKLKKIYSNPKEIPAEMRLALGKKIQTKKNEIYQFYKNPKETVRMEKTQKWVLFQLAKLFVGIPIVPGK